RAAGLGGLDPRGRPEQRDARLERFGIRGRAGRAGLQHVGGGAAGLDRGRRGRRGGWRRRGGLGGVLVACGGRGVLARAALLLGARGGGEFGVGHRHFVGRQQRVEVVLGGLGRRQRGVVPRRLFAGLAR